MADSYQIFFSSPERASTPEAEFQSSSSRIYGWNHGLSQGKHHQTFLIFFVVILYLVSDSAVRLRNVFQVYSVESALSWLHPAVKQIIE
jgi:hypothetical protein